MDFKILHDIEGRIRIHICQERMSYKQADTLCYFLNSISEVETAKVYERTCNAVIYYTGDKDLILRKIKAFKYSEINLPKTVFENTGRALNAEYEEKLMKKILWRFIKKLTLPFFVRRIFIGIRSFGYIKKGLISLINKKLEVSVLDATAISISLLKGNVNTASSIMFLLGIGELLEEWTHKKSVDNLARSMALNVNKVWLKKGEQEFLVNSSDILSGDLVVVRMGNVIPFDGEVYFGEAMVNQSSLTGESLPVKKDIGGFVYAGTVIEEGEITIKVKAVSGSTRFERIVKMIEESEKLKSKSESKAEHLADRLVPYTLLGTFLVWLLTRNTTKALSVLMVDFSCALKLSMPISVLSAIREASTYNITIKGGKYIEAFSEAKTLVFDKTGTLTKAKPKVKEVIPFNGEDEKEMLRIAACLEEHFPHSIAKAVVNEAKERGLEHEEIHSRVDYIVAHGIASYILREKVIIGSRHFVFDDEKCEISDEDIDKFNNLSDEYTHLYLAIENKLSAVIYIEDPVRDEALEVIKELKALGIEKIVMMTGDSERTASAVAKKVGVDEYYSEVLPEDKANFIENEKKLGRKVIMVGDGINDSPALSSSDVGIAISNGAEIAREIADITISADSLKEIVVLKKLSDALMKRIDYNYKTIVGINTGLIILGILGIIMPTTSALLHNTSTLAIGIKDMQNLLN